MPSPLASLMAPRLLLCLALICSFISSWSLSLVQEAPRQDNVATSVDPNKAPSELNHHIAGVFLLAIGLCILGGERYKSLVWLRWLPSILFIAAGLFLAAWSDREIWPRGNRGLSWLIYHDWEALQHKFYALLLLAIGFVEALQASAKYRRPWLSVIFPLFCVIGGVSLFFHHHGGGIAAAAIQTGQSSMVQATIPSGPLTAVPAAVHEHRHAPDAFQSSPTSSLSGNMKTDRLAPQPEPSHHHGMAGSEAKVQREHTWFAVVGFCIAIFRFLYDSAKPPARVRRYLWVNSLLLLGFLLLLYTE